MLLTTEILHTVSIILGSDEDFVESVNLEAAKGFLTYFKIYSTKRSH